MADKVAKPKKSKSKAKKDDKGVLAALPSTRPERIGTRRTGATVAAATRTETAAVQTAPKASASKPAKAASSKPATGESSYPRRKKPSAARRKAAAPRTFEPTEAAEAAAGAADERAAGVASEPRPRPVREGAPGMGTTSPDRERAPAAAGRGDEPREPGSTESGRPSGVELVSTAVQAAGELAQIGLTVGGRIIKRAVDRLPKP